MKKRRISRIGLCFLLPYLILVFIYLLLIILSRDPLILIYLFVFTFPWTLPSIGLFEYHNHAIGGNTTFAILWFLVLLNAAILYFIGLIIDRIGILAWIKKWVRNHSVLGNDERLK